MSVAYSAYVPCYDNASTLRRSTESVLEQKPPPAEVLIIDDGSTDSCTALLAGLPVRIIRQDRNLGRGAARARAMSETLHELLLSCDATVSLAPNFMEKAAPYFADPNVAGVCGRITQRPAQGAVERWRGRHLFKEDADRAVRHRVRLITGGAVVRASAVRQAGGYDARLRHNEDSDLGERLLAHGFDVIYDPGLLASCIARNTVGQVLERYWRWYAGKDEAVTWRGYCKNVVYSIKAMAAADLRAGDPGSAAISLLAPHYQFWKSRLRRLRRMGPKALPDLP